MKNMAAQCCAARWFGLLLVLMLGTIGCGNKEELQVPGKNATLNCGPKTVRVRTGDPKQFATPVAVYVCGTDIVTWDPADDVQTFEVEFKDEYPFEGPRKKFHKGDGKSPKTIPQPVLKVYPYKITVNSQPSADPQVVGGGNP